MAAFVGAAFVGCAKPHPPAAPPSDRAAIVFRDKAALPREPRPRGSLTATVQLVTSGITTDALRCYKIQDVLDCSAVHSFDSSYYAARSLVHLPADEHGNAVTATSTPTTPTVTDVAFYEITPGDLTRLQAHQNDWYRKMGGITAHPNMAHSLVYRGLGHEHRGVVDFVCGRDGRIHALLADVRSRTRILYVVGSLADGQWSPEGDELADYPTAFSPRVAIARDSDECIHMFWVAVLDKEERLIHFGSHDQVAEDLGRAKAMSFRVIAMANGDIALLCKTYNKEFDEVPGLKVGGDVSLSLRVLRHHQWSSWFRLRYIDAGEAARRGLPTLVDLNFQECALQEMGEGKFELIFLRSRSTPGVTIAYEVLETRT
jgi:hypothetical protein